MKKSICKRELPIFSEVAKKKVYLAVLIPFLYTNHELYCNADGEKTRNFAV